VTYRYFLSVTDDYSRRSALLFLEKKSEAFEKFQQFVSFWTARTGKRVSFLRSDNAAEFCSAEFDSYLLANGIKRELSCARSPQQNDVAERLNRTVMERVRAQLKLSGLPAAYWTYAASMAVVSINATPHRAIDDKIPNELWGDRDVDVRMLRVFGCEGFVHPGSAAHLKKFDARAERCVYLSPDFERKGFRVLNLESKCVQTRHDVQFNESVFPFTQEVEQVPRLSAPDVDKFFALPPVVDKGPVSTGDDDDDFMPELADDLTDDESDDGSGSGFPACRGACIQTGACLPGVRI